MTNDLETKLRERLEGIHSALDEGLGDTDISHIEDDEELRSEEPLQWAAEKLATILWGGEFASAPTVRTTPGAAEALTTLVQTAKLLLENAEGCAVNHYGEDFEIHGRPGWLDDCRLHIEEAEAALTPTTGKEA